MRIQIKKIITAIASVLLFAVYIMIFSFSSDDAAASSGVSQKVTRYILNIYYHLAYGKGQAVAVTGTAVNEMEAIVRKSAHFTEYSAVGFLAFFIVILWITDRKRCAELVLIQLLVSASIDELHQYFVPGRHSSIKDVLIDTAGGIAGMLIVYLFFLLFGGRKKNST